jgi:FkbM family methyltransferase
MNNFLHQIGNIIQGTSLESVLDQAFYKVVGPRDVNTTVGNYTGTFAAHSSREYHGVRSLDGEKQITETFLSLLSKNDVAWDVGANVGWHAVLMGQVAPTIAFEPNPRSFLKLHQNICLNPASDVVPVCAGIDSADDEKITSVISIEEGAGAAVLSTPDPDMNDYHSALVVGGYTKPSLFTVPDALKLDVQGLESEVLTSFGEQLSSLRLLMVEYHRDRIAGDWNSKELHGYVCDAGFSVVDSSARRDDVIRVYEQT